MSFAITGQLFVDGRWMDGTGESARSVSPFHDDAVWQGHWAKAVQASDAIESAHRAFANWSRVGLEGREAIVKAFGQVIQQHRSELARLIARESGKPLWEADTEVATCIGKVQNSIDAIRARRWTTTETTGDQTTITRYQPLGVMAVLGPFNLPAHLPGAHIVPALLAGNTVVFKPSERTPGVGEFLARAWQAAGLPTGVLNLIQGDGTVAQELVNHERTSGVLFTGSYRVGQAIHRALAGKPEKMLALEMGGNNALVIDRTSDIPSAVLQVILSAYITSGQRCTCARRLIVTRQGNGQSVIEQLRHALTNVKVGDPLGENQPFMGALISKQAAADILAGQQRYLDQGGVALHPSVAMDGLSAALKPGLIELTNGRVDDCELFGPLLIVQHADNLEQAVTMANDSRYGLSAGLISDDREAWEYFVTHIRAGIVNWNRQTTGASGRLAFGGIGWSGNHRPSGFFAADYCSYPVASMESGQLPPAVKPTGLEDIF